MRFLETTDGRTYRLMDEFIQKDSLPPYAILSHTWDDGQEVILDDIVRNSKSKYRRLRESVRLRPQSGKKGYDKLAFCARQAKRDGLRYFWVDTCCIDKKNGPEVHRSINSMFQWYKNAAKCYVYLSDVSAESSNRNSGSPPWHLAFANSRWFTRGWTLQELLAPTVLEFFSREGVCLGSRLELKQLIHEITDIPTLALSGTPLEEFGVDERLSWAVERQTTREEDEVYALLGIFGVNLPFIYDEGYDRTLRRLLDKIDELRAALHEKGSKAKRLLQSNMPFRRDQDFVSRDVLDIARELCEKPAGRAALLGLGGVGKSQIAIECCYRILDDYPTTQVFWVHAETRDRLKEGYLEIAKKTGINGWDDPKADIVQLVHAWLINEVNRRWILVLDSADNPDVFARSSSAQDVTARVDSATTESLSPAFLPSTLTGSILVTSRSRQVASMLTGTESSVIEVGPMTDQNALELLQKKFNFAVKKEEAEALIAALDHMPLALTQAAAFINRTPRMSISRYLTEVDHDPASLSSKYLVDNRRDPNASNSIMTTWQISFDYIRKRSSAAARLLSLMSMFDRQGIPKSLLVNEYQEAGQANADFDHDMYMLTSFCLVKASTDEESFEMHGLVQSATRTWLEQNEELLQWKEISVLLMNTQYPVGEYENVPILRALFPHAQAALKNVPATEEALEAWAMLAFKMAWYKKNAGNHDEAYKLGLDSYNVRRLLWGEDSRMALDSLNSLAIVTNLLGRYEEAKEMHRKAIERTVRTLGADSWDTLSSMINLASLYNDECQWTEAEELLLQALETSKTTFGLDHVLTLNTTVMLANTYRFSKRWAEAVELERQMLQAHEERLGPTHRRTLAVKSNLAFTYRGQGRLQEAEQMQLEILEAYQAKSDPDDEIDMLSYQVHLATTYRAQSRLDEAKKLGLQVLALSKERLGPDHFSTISRMSSLSATYEEQGRYKDAEELESQALQLRIEKFGHNHILTLDSKSDLAMTYRNLEQFDKAEELGREVWEAHRRKLGGEHPVTLDSKAGLARTYRRQGRLDEAARLEESIVETRTRVFGPEQLETLWNISALAATYWLQGRKSEAWEMMERCVRLIEGTAGAGHVMTVTCKNTLERWRKLKAEEER